MAKGFQFRLQSVLDHRERLEQLRMGEVSKAQRDRLEIEERIRSIQDQMNAQRRDLRDRLSGPAPAGGEAGASRPVPMDEVRLAAGASLHGLVRLQRAAIELAGAHQKLGKARHVLLRAAVDRKAVELLRTRERAEHLRRMARRESDELDDLTVMRARQRTDPAEAVGGDANTDVVGE